MSKDSTSGKNTEEKKKPRRRWVRWVVLLIVIAVIGLVVAGGWRSAKKNEVPAVRVTEVIRKDVVGRVLARGSLKAKRQVDVGSELSGRVAKVEVEVGDQVKKGDPLFSLEDTQSENALAQLRSALSSAQAMVDRANLGRKELERQRERDAQLVEKKVISPEVYRTLLSRLELAKADQKQAAATLTRARLEVDRAKDALGKTLVVAPMDGTVVDVTLESGQVVSSFGSTSTSGLSVGGFSSGVSTEQVVVADLSQIIADLKVDELDIVRVKMGQNAVIKAEGIQGESFESVITRVGLLGRDEAGAVLFNVKAHIAMDGEGMEENSTADAGAPPVKAPVAESGQAVPTLLHKLRPGMSVYAEIEVEREKDAVAVPVAAVLEGDGTEDGKQDRVFVLEEKDGALSAREQEVTLGPADGDHVAVLSGLTGGEKVIEGPYRVLRDLESGDPVRKEDKNKKRRFFGQKEEAEDGANK